MKTSVTLSMIEAVKTKKTDETDLVNNEKFLLTLFGENLLDARPVVVSFKGDPTQTPSKSWLGQSWHNSVKQADKLSTQNNNYFSLAVFKPDEAGKVRRLKTRFHALYAIMLDDVGSKVDIDRLTLPPSWLLETSPGNHQAGYLLSEPLTDGATADRLMNSIVDAGLCDPGASGPRARLARLPQAVNGKLSPPFKCRMVTWSPTLRYSIDELVGGLQLDIVPEGRQRKGGSEISQGRPAYGDPIWIPRPEENAILNALRERSSYKAPLGDGKHDITCPWVTEHTGKVDGGTAYFEPDGDWPIGGFKCLHGHCADRHIRDLLNVLNIEVGAARMKPTIRVMPGEIHRVVDAAERELANTHRYYQRGGLIVTVVTDPGTLETRVQEISQPALVRALAGAATWERFDLRNSEWARIDPPSRHTTVVHDATSFRYLPVLNGLTRQPYLRPDGSVTTAPGYDPTTGMFGVFNTKAFSVREHSTRKQAEAALSVLKDLIEEFCFATKTDLSATLTAILTATVRPSLPHAPMFHVRAHMVGSGKSYLCELITAFATPQRGTPTTFPKEDEECRKLLLAELLRAPAVIEFDNLTGDLVAHKSLCTALTSEHISGRILGVSKTATVNTRALFLSSGNNVGPVQDMARRCITISLSPACEIPAARDFKRPDLVGEVLQQRGKYISAALTIINAWIMAGRPKTECKSLAGFSEWSELCRQPLLWLGLADPTESVFEAIADDPDRELVGRLLTEWQSVFGKSAAMVRHAVQRASLNSPDCMELREVLHDIADDGGIINRRKLGWWIKRHAGRVVDGRRFIRESGNRSAESWKVESVLSVLSASDDRIDKSVSPIDGKNAYEIASKGA